jgi:type IV secretory pathway TrbF-like protein
MYLIGRLNGFASVIKFSKRNFNVDWKTEIQDKTATSTDDQDTKMSEILSVV